MAGPRIDNQTPFSVCDLYALDERGRPVLTVLARATYRIEAAAGRLVLHTEQMPAKLAGEPAFDAEIASYRYEPETAFIKVATDVVLIGHAWAHDGPALALDVGFKVGPVQKVARVHGDRYWVKTGGQIIASRAQPFTKVPLVYERAFGGWDKAHKDPATWKLDPRNPVGVGFGNPLKFVEEGRVKIANIEDQRNPIRYGETPEPVGFGFVSPDWQSRARFAGTYDDQWSNTQKPLLPRDFDRRFFNAASVGLVAPGYLRGDEEVVVVNASPVRQLRFVLPGTASPTCRIRLTDGTVVAAQLSFDTLIVDTDEMLVFMLWRACVPVPTGAHDVGVIDVAVPASSAQRAAVR